MNGVIQSKVTCDRKLEKCTDIKSCETGHLHKTCQSYLSCTSSSRQPPKISRHNICGRRELFNTKYSTCVKIPSEPGKDASSCCIYQDKYIMQLVVDNCIINSNCTLSSSVSTLLKMIVNLSWHSAFTNFVVKYF